MVSEEEVKQGLISAEDVGPPLAEDEHSESAESLPDSDLVEDLIQDESVEPSVTSDRDEHPKVRPLDWEFFASVRDYVKGQSCFPTDKPLSAVVTHEPRDQKVFDIFFWSDWRRRVLEVSLPEVLSSNESEPPVIVEDYSHRHRRPERYEVRGLSSVTVNGDYVKSCKIVFHPVRRNSNFFLRLSDPSSYEYKKSLFLWKMVSSIRLQILNSILLRFILEELRMYAGTSEFDGNLAGVEKQEKELLALLGTTKWTRKFLTAKRCSNLLADKIWRALRDVHVPTGLMEDVLEDLRTRFKRGRIWENDPWWPNDR